MKKPNLAIVGATGLVGSTFLEVLEELDFPFDNLYLMASAKSAGKVITFKGKDYVVEELNEHSFDKDIDIALFSAGGDTSKKYAPIAAAHGVTVVDNSSAWRMDPEVPLVVPEVNPQDIAWNKGIIANPNCSTIQAMVPLKPLHDKYKIDENGQRDQEDPGGRQHQGDGHNGPGTGVLLPQRVHQPGIRKAL